MRRRPSFLPVLLAGCALPGLARASDEPPLPQTVVVSATRHAMALIDAPASMGVVTPAQIAERGADNLFEALRGEPGLSLIGRTISGRRNISLRGMDGRHTLFLVDGMRISPDVKESWRDPKVAWLTRGATHPAVEQMLPGCMTRAFLHGALWANDPDCLLVREEASQLTLPEVQTLVSVLSLTGGLLVLSDDIGALSAERRALAEQVLPPLGEPARALDALTEERPERFVRLHARAAGREGAGGAGERHEVLAALINWHDGPLERLLVPSELGAELGGVPGFDRRGGLHAFELWSERYERIAPGQSIHSVIPPHGTALWLLRPARLEPQVVSITHHLGQTTTLLLDEAWDAERRALTLRILAPAMRQGRVLVAVPTGMRVRDAEVTGAAELAGRHEGGSLVAIHVTLRPPGRRDESQRDALLTVHFE